MIDGHFVILGTAVGSIGTLLYIRDTLRGVTQPNRVTWLLWAAAPLLAFAVEVHEGVGIQALMTFVVGFSPLLVLIASLRNRAAVWRIGALDYLCGALSVAGLAAWLVTRHGTIALVASIVSDGMAALPTVYKSWLRPDTETAAIYVGAVFNAGLTLLTVKHWTTPLVAFPLYILVLAAAEAALVAGRLGLRLRAARGVGVLP
jgi:hypothetical protein